MDLVAMHVSPCQTGACGCQCYRMALSKESKHVYASDIQACCQVGAQVILLKNLDLTGDARTMLVNGSRGTVIGFVPATVGLPHAGFCCWIVFI